MRFFVRAIVSICLLILVVVVVAALWPWLPVVQDKFSTASYREWLSGHASVLSVNEPVSDIGFFEGTYDASLIILGEVHGYRAVQAVDLLLLSNFAQRGESRSYLAELSPRQALAFNHYLETGDEEPLRLVFDDWAARSMQWGNQEFFHKLRQIRRLNLSLPPEQRFWFIGVDQLSDLDDLSSLASGIQDDVRPGFTSYNEVQALNAELLTLALGRGAEARRYTHILENIARVAELASETGRKFYGLWGIFHASKATVNGFEPLARILNSDGGSFEGSVVTISTACIDGCFNMMPARGLPGFVQGANGEPYVDLPVSYDDVYLQRVRGVNDLAHAAGDHDITLFQIAGEGTPYNQGPRLQVLSGYLTFLQRFEYGGPAAEISDYVVVIRQSGALTPWQGESYDPTGGGSARAGIGAVEVALGVE